MSTFAGSRAHFPSVSLDLLGLLQWASQDSVVELWWWGGLCELQCARSMGIASEHEAANSRSSCFWMHQQNTCCLPCTAWFLSVSLHSSVLDSLCYITQSLSRFPLFISVLLSSHVILYTPPLSCNDLMPSLSFHHVHLCAHLCVCPSISMQMADIGCTLQFLAVVS